MAKKEENPIFVGLTNKDELRRGILECSKSILESLKDYERFKVVREEKLKLINQFRSDIREISKSINALRASLPQVKEVDIKRPEVKQVFLNNVSSRSKPKKEERPKVVKVEKTELDKLESELNEIEEKLNELS